MKAIFLIVILNQIFTNLAFSSMGTAIGGGGGRSTAYFGTASGAGGARDLFNSSGIISNSPFNENFFPDYNNPSRANIPRWDWLDPQNDSEPLHHDCEGVNNLLEINKQNSRLEFLLKSEKPAEDTSEELKEELYLKNKLEFKNALELLERGETEAVLEDGTVIPLLKMVKKYAEIQFIWK